MQATAATEAPSGADRVRMPSIHPALPPVHDDVKAEIASALWNALGNLVMAQGELGSQRAFERHRLAHALIETPPRYALSFTSGALLVREALVATPIYLREHDWGKVRKLIEEDNLLQSRTRSSGFRLAREVVQRLSVVSNAELQLLLDATPTERGYLMWAAACRRYDLIGEFAEEVLRERFLVLAQTLDHGDFDSFIRGKALWHEEVADLKDSTLRKLRSTVFRMLVEAGLLSDDGRIVQAVLSTRLVDTLANDIRFFPAEGAA